MKRQKTAQEPGDFDLFLNTALQIAIERRESAFSHPYLKEGLAKHYPWLSKKQLNEYNRFIKLVIRYADEQFTALLEPPDKDPALDKFELGVRAKYPWVSSQNLQKVYAWFLEGLYR